MLESWTFTVDGRDFVATVERDDFCGAPWEEHDGHGPVSGWTRRAKHPGEMVLSESRGERRYYDFAQACRIARNEGWDAPPYRTGTARQRAARAALADFEYLRAWCNDEWCFVTVSVAPVCPCCGAADESRSQTVGGVESSDFEYLRTIALELAGEVPEAACAA